MLTNTLESLRLGMCSARCLLCQPPEQLGVATWHALLERPVPGGLLLVSRKAFDFFKEGGTCRWRALSPTLAPFHLLWSHNSRVAASDSHSCKTSLILNRAAEPMTGEAAFEPTSYEKRNPLFLHVSAVRTSMCKQKNLRSYCNILFHI